MVLEPVEPWVQERLNSLKGLGKQSLEFEARASTRKWEAGGKGLGKPRAGDLDAGVAILDLGLGLSGPGSLALKVLWSHSFPSFPTPPPNQTSLKAPRKGGQ